MQNSSSPPSISASPATINGASPRLDGGEPSDVLAVTRTRRRSPRMQYRFARVVTFALWLFARLVFWQILARRYFRDSVERGNLERWKRYTREFRHFAVEMGGVMIKLGQFISTRADILPEEVIAELASLRDEVPSVPGDEIRAIVARELGPIEERFDWFDNTPVAAASLGQVHRARLKNDERVVVKVQRPGIDEICYTDLDALHLVARVASKFRFISRRADAVALAREFGRVLLEELSYTHEAQNAVRFAEMFRDDPGVYIPQVYTEHSTNRTLTLEDVTTIKIDDYAALEAAGISRKAVAQRLMDTYLRQVFEEHFFHADPHAGNLFVYPLPADSANGASSSGKPFYLIFVDFGMTASLTPQIAAGLINTLTAVIHRDARRLVQSYVELGFLLPGTDMQRLEQATTAVFDQVWGMSMSEMSDMSYDSMAQIGSEFSDLLFDMPFQMPQDFIYLGRTMAILMGMATSLDPTFNPWRELAPYAQKMMAQTLSSTGNAADSLVGGVLGSPVVQTLIGSGGSQMLLNIGQTLLGRGANPDAIASMVIERIQRGEIKLAAEPSAQLQKRLARVEAQGRRTARAVLSGSLLIASTLLYTHGDLVPALIAGGLSAAFFFAALLVRE